MERGNPGGIACFVVVAVAICTLIGGIVLRAAVSIYNKMVGGPDSPKAIPEPSLERAFSIMFVISVINGVAGFLIGMLLGHAAGTGAVRARDVQILTQLACIFIGIVFTTAMLSAMLPTTIGRAMLVTILHTVIVIVSFGAVAFYVKIAFH